MTLRTRVLAGLALVALVLTGVATLITITTRDQLVDQVDARLQSIAPDHIDRYDDRRDRDDAFDDLAGTDPPDQVIVQADGTLVPLPPERISDVYEGVIDASGELTTRFFPNAGDGASPPEIDEDQLPASGDAIFTTGSIDDSITYRVLARRLGDEYAITALPIDDLQSTVNRLVLVEALGVLAILAVLGLVAWWVVHLGIRPVKEMTRTAGRIADGDLDVRIPESAEGTESGDLAVALNRMLGTIGDALDERAASEERLRRFVADASHELRTPVTTIRGYAELYRHGGLPQGEPLDDAMRRTEQEAVRMGRLVEEMLVLAKLDQERPLETGPVDVHALVGDAAADARVADPDREVVVELDDDELVVEGDEDRLRQVLANVVGNALVHTDAAITLRAHRDPGADAAVIEIADAGDGMPPEIAERVTERFFRADPARSRHRGGSGLGLSIVDAVLRAHGGSVEIDSAEGAGTTVRLRLPVTTPAVA